MEKHPSYSWLDSRLVPSHRGRKVTKVSDVEASALWVNDRKAAWLSRKVTR